MTTMKVAGVEEAIALAAQLRDEGRYDWFRGQLNAAWPPHSSLRRVQEREGEAWRETHLPRMRRFARWLAGTPGLQALAATPDAGFAVAQHHGLPTHYIDFTTDPAVAGFFATDAPQPLPPGSTCCIVCLDTEDLRDHWAGVREATAECGEPVPPEIAFVDVPVPNLWRLEAQSGVFLRCEINWELLYPPDLIVFPYGGPPARPTRAEVYPERKSALELLLDSFFDNERKLEQEHVLPDLVKTLRRQGVAASLTRTHADAQGYMSIGFDGGRLEPHPSWAAAAAWRVLPVERAASVQTRELRLALPLAEPGPALRDHAATAIFAALALDPGLRNHHVRWHIDGADAAPWLASGEVVQGLDRLWDGLRRLPYGHADVAHALATWLGLARDGFVATIDTARERATVDRFFGPSLAVEFSAADGGSSRAHVGEAALRAAMRGDLVDCLAGNFRDRAGEVRILLQLCRSPERLFDFDALTALFVRQIVPSQMRRSPPHYFHAASLAVLGLP